ncbi:MAG: carcinine hydrolase/isopenicillin-N N-acyltransferase family protein [Gammaproteobacteria bacterium]|nr:carcinine hydrolase/isopenicillin-N N-acyltransferase family protein [Gammaproteobacteria bacterium]
MFTPISIACTGFGVITDSGTLTGRNRDYYYDPQQFELMVPIQQFNNWYENNYNHNNTFYALTSKNNVSMGVNQHGLTVIEEDSPLAKYAKTQRRLQQPENGTAEGMIKYGILQNFNTVDEIVPYLSKIFSVADPQFYQITDGKKLLTVEVAYGKNNTDKLREFTYKIYTKKNDYFAHTNHYLSPEFSALNQLRSDEDFFLGTHSRLQKITDHLTHTKVKNMTIAAHWLMDTHSDVAGKNSNIGCMNSSLFRSALQGVKSINLNSSNDKITGTVSSMVISNNGDLNHSYIYLIMLDSIIIDKNNNQVIKYRKLQTTLSKLFSEPHPNFTKHEFVRKPPINGVCS